jgi:hypothetical protein
VTVSSSSPDTSAPVRQRAVLEELVGRVVRAQHVAGAILLGSLASGNADDLSDVDLIVVTPEAGFEAAWQDRCGLHGDGVLAHWDVLDETKPRAAAHKWLTRSVVLVECLLVEPGSGVRLAEPHRVVAGPDGITEALVPRPPVDRGEMRGLGPAVADLVGELSVEDAYDVLKMVVRRNHDAGR